MTAVGYTPYTTGSIPYMIGISGFEPLTFHRSTSWTLLGILREILSMTSGFSFIFFQCSKNINGWKHLDFHHGLFLEFAEESHLEFGGLWLVV
jgi:hypothetical protein